MIRPELLVKLQQLKGETLPQGRPLSQATSVFLIQHRATGNTVRTPSPQPELWFLQTRVLGKYLASILI